GGRLAAWANEPSDDLEPDIEKCNQAAKPEPLKCVTVVFVDACAHHGPVALQAFDLGAVAACLQHREMGQPQTGLRATCSQVEILPDAGRPLGAIAPFELVEPTWRRSHAAFYPHRPLGRLHGWKLRAVLK